MPTLQEEAHQESVELVVVNGAFGTLIKSYSGRILT